MFCAKCGKEIKKGSKYCSQCGSSTKTMSEDSLKMDATTKDGENIIEEEHFVSNASQRSDLGKHKTTINFGQWYIRKKAQLINKYKKITPRQRNTFLFMLFILMFSIGAYVYFSIPKISDVEKLRMKEDSKGLCLLVENNSQTDRYTPVLITATRVILEINDTGAVSRIANVVSNEKNNVKVRIAIVEQFADKNMIMPGLFNFIADKNLNGEVRQAIISTTNRVNSNIFKEKVESELAAAKKIAKVDDYIDAIINTRTFDVNGEKSDSINRALYEAYIYRIKQIAYGSGREEIKKTLNEMVQVDSIISAKDKDIIKSLKRYISDDDEFYKKMEKFNERERQANADMQTANVRINEINSYLTKCSRIRAYIIDSIGGDNIYEISFYLGGINDRAILKTNGTSFTTKGWFEMFANRMGNRQISLLNGQTTEWPYFEEDTAAQKKVSELEIADLALYGAQNKIYEINAERTTLSKQHKNNNASFYQLVEQLGHEG